MATQDDSTLNRAQFCAFAGITKHLFDQLVAAGMPVLERPATRGGEYRINREAALAWLVHWRAGPNDGFDRERARLVAAQADLVEHRNAKLRAALLPADEVEAGWRTVRARSRVLLMKAAEDAARAVAAVSITDPAAAEREIRLELTRCFDAALAELAEMEV